MRLLGLLCLSLSVASGQTYTISTFAGGGPPDVLPATSAALNIANGVALDAAKNLFIATEDGVFRVDAATGLLSRILSTGAGAIATDSVGNVYVAAGDRLTVKKISNGIVTTIAGGGIIGVLGDGGPAIAGWLSDVSGLATDPAGNLYIADPGTQRIRKVSNGVITTIAGGVVCTLVGAGPSFDCPAGFSGDGGQATNGQLANPFGVTVDAAGVVYIADRGNGRVRQVSNGVITTIAGGGTASGDNIPATSAQLNPGGITVDSVGNLYVVSNLRVRKIANGIINTVAGTGTSGFSGDNGPAIDAQLDGARGVAVDPDGNFYIAENARIRRVSNGIITTVAGNGAQTSSGDGGPATLAQLNNPKGVAVDAAGTVYIADSNNSRVRKVSNGVITTVAETAADAIAVDASGNVYMMSAGGIREISNGVFSLIPVNCGSFGCAFHGIAVGPDGAVYVSDYALPMCVSFGCSQGHAFVRKISDGVVTIAAGNGHFGLGGNGGLATNAELSQPTGLAVDSMGNLYIADQTGGLLNPGWVREVSNGIITAVVGDAFPNFTGDGGPATSASGVFSSVAVDQLGNLYTIGDNRVRKVTNGVITTIAGNGATGFSGDGGPATSAQFNNPTGLAVDSAGRVYIADAGNNRIRVLTPLPLASGMDLTITKTQATAFTQGQLGAIYSIVVGNSRADPTSGTVTVTDTAPPGLIVTGMTGPGWNCVPPSGPCTRADSLAGGSYYPVITVTVNVGNNAAPIVTGTATVAGGGETNPINNTASDLITITPRRPIISSISPNPVRITAGTQTMFLNGSGFQNVNKVTLLGPGSQIIFQGAQLTILSPSQLSIQIEPGTPAGGWTATVTNVAGMTSLSVPLTIASPAATSFAVPQFVFGGPWYTALYFANTTNAAASITVNFIGDDGTPLQVPLAGIGTLSSYTFSLNPKSTVILEALDHSGVARQGWVETTLPDGVIGHAIFRQVVSGRADQEAVVPLTPESSQSADMTYDDTQFTTSVAFLNPTNQAETVNITAFRADGTQAGSTQVQLAPRSKLAIVLRDLPGMNGVLGQRGRVVFFVPVGFVSVLGLRFGGSAFTSIPVVFTQPNQNPTLPVTLAVPQFVFGEPWYTALYISDTGGTFSFPVSFVGNDGAPLAARLVGAGATDFQMVSLGSYNTKILEAPNIGSPTEGWAEVTLSFNAIGYAVFRQVIPGRFNQEALVPLTSEANLHADMIYDDVQFATCVALVNPSDQATTATITAYSANGAQIGSAQVPLGPRAKLSTILRNVPGLEGMVGNRGWVSFSVPNGNISVLGLRFGAEAFTSIPVISR